MQPVLIFDYDGTIHNTMHIYKPSFCKAYKWLTDNGYAEPENISSDRMASWLGLNVRDMWNDFLPELPEEIKEYAGKITGDSMHEMIRMHQAVWYPGAEDTLTSLKAKGYDMYVLSNCKRAYRDINMETFRMKRWFKDFVDCESYDFVPKHEILPHIAEVINRPYIVIGDRGSDIACAETFGGKSVGCLYGYGTRDELKYADRLISDISELTEILC